MTVVLVYSAKIDVCAITETWLKSDDDVIRQECQPDGYIFADCPRQSGRAGGGTGLLCRSPLSQSLVRSGDNKSFEFSELIVKGPSVHLKVIVVYRPTYSKEHPVPASVFFDEFAEYLQSLILTKEPIIFTGDFNFHVDDSVNRDAIKFQELLLEFGLKQHVNVATHRDGHTLDLIISRENDSLIMNEPTADYFISDHAFVTCQLAIQKPTAVTKSITFRQFNQSINQIYFQIVTGYITIQAQQTQIKKCLLLNYTCICRCLLSGT